MLEVVDNTFTWLHVEPGRSQATYFCKPRVVGGSLKMGYLSKFLE
jgi:hypothetical protein